MTDRLRLAVLVVFLAGCAGGGGGDDPAADVRADLPIMTPDVAADQALDRGADPAAEIEAEPDQSGDVSGDPAPDVNPVVVPDAGAETGAEVGAELGAEPAPEAAEPSGDAPSEAGEPFCGDTICETATENCATCPDDCGKCPEDPCGDDDCNAAGGETCATCPLDCGGCPACPDSTCDGPEEDCLKCPQDCGPCPPACPDGECNGGETCSTCIADCGPCAPSCPDGHCNGDETCSTCPEDCGDCPPACGDGDCTPPETCKDCQGDCGACPATCGDKTCGAGEDCQTCPDDCAPCPPTLWFRSDWSETLSGPIVAGRRLRIRYDLDRLTACRQTHNGYPGWTMTVFYTFDLSKPASEVQVVTHGMGGSAPFEPIIDVPADARDIWFWASNTGVEGCVAWDSDYGKNYMMPVFTAAEVSKPVDWAGWGAGAIDFQYINEGGAVSMGDADPAWFFDSLLGGEVTTAILVQVYVAGVTDRVYQNAAVAAQVGRTAVTATAETDFAKGAGEPGKPFVATPMEFQYQAANNFFYRWYLGSYGYVMDNGPFPEGLYGYRLAVRTAEGPVTRIGKTGDAATARRLVYAKDSSTGCPLFPGTPPSPPCPK